MRALGAYLALSAVVALVACGSFSPEPSPDEDVADAGAGATDAGMDAIPSAEAAVDAGTRCHDTDPFGVPTELDGVNASGVKSGPPTLRRDEKEIFFQRGPGKIFVARRGDRTLPFDSAKLFDTSDPDAGIAAQDPSISGDGLVLYIGLSNRLARMKRPSDPTSAGPSEPILPVPKK